MRMHNPLHPGALLRRLYLQPLGISITRAAEALGVSRSALSQLANGHSRVHPDMAWRLARAFKTTPEFWLNAQRNYDLWEHRGAARFVRSGALYSKGRSAVAGLR
jgi:addiction module HigA family antidote